MNHLKTFHRVSKQIYAIVAAATFMGNQALAEPVVKLKGEGLLAVSKDGISSFALKGNGSHLGNFICYGEIQFVRGAEAGTWEGEGVAAIIAANGDLLVGVVKWQVGADGNGGIAFSWRDFVQFSNGCVVHSTGRFVESRPAGAISRIKSTSDGSSNIIAILIG